MGYGTIKITETKIPMFMITVKTSYLGEKRTEAEHVRSGNRLITDAPLDNNGRGEAFSPTDLVATALASCMMTVMGIKADTLGVSLEGLRCEVLKVMASEPRRIAEIHIDMHWPTAQAASADNQELMKRTALACPVAKSLSADLRQEVTFHF